MIALKNVKIGKKIGIALGGVVLILGALAGIALWGNSTSEHMSQTTIERLTKARLAEKIQGDTAAIAQLIARMIVDKKYSTETMNQITGIRKTRKEALEEFRRLADTPTSIQHGTDMAALVDSDKGANENLLSFIKSGRLADAAKENHAASEIANALLAKASEAAEFQVNKTNENEKNRHATSGFVWNSLIGGSILAMLAAILLGVFLTRLIATPLAAIVTHLDGIAEGDLSKDTPADLRERTDEIGMLGQSAQKMTVALRNMVHEISSGIKVLSASSTELMQSSSQMTAGSHSVSDKAHSVSAAAEEMSSNITSVAAGMEQTTANLAHVASATDQMTATIGEIAQNSENARRITDEATRQAARITEQINQLGAAAQEIGKVTETITEISSQTNLLALNATIEAARAGAAGKGFAVVATEIKALAQQTASATEDIRGRIEGVQTATTGGIAEIGKISQVISEVSSIVASIAAAIEEQSAATKDIARNISEASAGVTDSNTRVAQTSQVSREIARDIVSVDHAAGEMAEGSGHVRSSSSNLSSVAEQLTVTVGRFRA